MRFQSTIACLSVFVSLSAGCSETTVDPIGRTDGGASDASDAAVDHDAYTPPPRAPRLVVADHTGLSIWNAEAIAMGASPAPDAHVAVAGAAGLAAQSDRLFVAAVDSTDAIRVYDDAYALDAASVPAFAFTAADVSGPYVSDYTIRISVDAQGALWAPHGIDGPAWIRGAVDATDRSAPVATFTHMWMQVETVAYEPVSDRVFGGQISGAGLQIYRAASTRTGAVMPDATLDAECASWASTIEGTRFYAGCQPDATPGSLRIWNDAGALDGPRAADVTLTFGASEQIWDVRVVDDVLFVTTAEPASVRVYLGAAALTADRAPDHTITDIGSQPRRIALDSRGWLYVLSTELASPRITIVRDATTAPAVWATLSTTEAPMDLVVLE